jgi:hypothetical protein
MLCNLGSMRHSRLAPMSLTTAAVSTALAEALFRSGIGGEGRHLEERCPSLKLPQDGETG